MQPKGYTIFIVEDDQSVRDALGLLLGLRGYSVAMFANAESFLMAYRPEWCGSLLIDIRMPGIDGLTLQKLLLECGCQIPAILMTGHGDVALAREAFRSHAVDFLEKPIDHVKLMSAIEEAFVRQRHSEDRENRRSALNNLVEGLTPREKEVMQMVVDGRHNRHIAEALRISARTVEIHKAHMMTKLQVKSVPDLVRLSLVARGLIAQHDVPAGASAHPP